MYLNNTADSKKVSHILIKEMFQEELGPLSPFLDVCPQLGSHDQDQWLKTEHQGAEFDLKVLKLFDVNASKGMNSSVHHSSYRTLWY